MAEKSVNFKKWTDLMHTWEGSLILPEDKQNMSLPSCTKADDLYQPKLMTNIIAGIAEFVHVHRMCPMVAYVCIRPDITDQ